MAYMIAVTEAGVEVRWIPDGAGPMTQACAQKIVFRSQPSGTGIGETPTSPATGGWPVGPGPVGILVPGGDAPTIANFATALTGSATAPTAGSLAADLYNQINAVLGRIQGFASGGG